MFKNLKDATVQQKQQIAHAMEVAKTNDSYAGVTKAKDVMLEGKTAKLLPFAGKEQPFKVKNDAGEEETRFWIPVYFSVAGKTCGINLGSLHRNSNLPKLVGRELLSEFGATLMNNAGLEARIVKQGTGKTTAGYEFLMLEFADPDEPAKATTKKKAK